MRSALVDNATLQSAMRVEGRVPLADSRTVTGDILSLENLIQAVLFYDKVSYLSKGSLPKSKEAKLFLRSFHKINLEEESLRQLFNLTNEIADSLIPCIEGGRLTSDNPYRYFMESLNLDMEFGWKKIRSTYYLAFHLLQKASSSNLFYLRELLNMTFSELTDKSYCREIRDRIPLLYDHSGQIINALYKTTDEKGRLHGCKLSPQLSELFCAVNYLAFRSIFYTLAGRSAGAALILSPLRSNFQLTCIFKEYLNGAKTLQTADQLRKRLNRSAASHIISGFDPNQPILSVRMLPMFSAWMMENMEPSNFIDSAFQLREEKEFVLTRLHLNEIETILQTGQRKNLNLLKALTTEIDRQMDGIRDKYQIKSVRSSSYTLSLTLFNLDEPGDLPTVPGMRRFANTGACEDNETAVKKFGVVKKSIKDDLARMQELETMRKGVAVNICSGEGENVSQSKRKPLFDPLEEGGWSQRM